MIHSIKTAVKSGLILAFLAYFSLASARAQDPDAPLHPDLPYTYPFDSSDLGPRLPTKPIVLEMFSSLDCLFCPRAEKLLTDLVAKTAVVALVCHTDPEGADYPLSRSICVTRQEGYSARLTDGLLYTPQMVLNGHIDAVGHEFDDVEAGLKTALSDSLITLPVRAGSVTGTYLIDLPDLKLDKGADLNFITYRPPYTVLKTLRQSATRPDPLVRVVSRITPLGSWDGRKKTLTVSFAPTTDAAGFVLLVQRVDGTVVAFAEFKG